jgi:hypothetical protein
MVRLHLAVTLVLEEVTGSFGISFGDYPVLAVVRRSPGQRSAPTAIHHLLRELTVAVEAVGLPLRRRNGRGSALVVIAQRA